MELSSYASDDSTTYLKIMLTFDPVLPVTRDNNDEVSPSMVIPDDRLLAIHASKWLDSIRGNEWTAKRPYKPFAVNSSGFQVFICRYLTSQKPPDGFQTRRGAIQLVSKFLPNDPFLHHLLASNSGSIVVDEEHSKYDLDNVSDIDEDVDEYGETPFLSRFFQSSASANTVVNNSQKQVRKKTTNSSSTHKLIKLPSFK
jgi:hypothetical protein